MAMREDLPEPTLVPDDESPGYASFAEEEVAPTLREKPDNGGSMGDSANEVDNIFVRPPSCAKMGEMLRQIPHGSDFDLPPSKMFEITKMVIKFPFFVLNVWRLCISCSRYSDSCLMVFAATDSWHLWHGAATRTFY